MVADEKARSAPHAGGGDDADADAETLASSERFNRVRQAQAATLLEDYAEMIDDLICEHGEARVADIAARMGVAHPTATKAVARLKREGLAVSRPYRGVFLTEEGKAMADAIRTRHSTVRDVLLALGVPGDVADVDAEGMEHHVSPETLAAFKAFLARRRRGANDGQDVQTER